jgi:hypothetical protein
MSESTQVQAIGAPVQQLWSESISMALEGFAVSQAQGKQWLQSAFELGAASAKDSLKYAEELRSRLTEATTSANALVKEQSALWGELPKDPVAAAQKVIAASVEGSRKALEVGAEALKRYVTLVDEAWARLEKVSQDTREHYVATVTKLQAIVESAARKS